VDADVWALPAETVDEEGRHSVNCLLVWMCGLIAERREALDI
jgi:hypothetical protein